MNIYIPEHLFNLDIVGQLKDMYLYYKTLGLQDTPGSTTNGVSQSIDPVKKFIYLRLDSTLGVFVNGSQNYADVVNYISNVFFSVKGTCKVIDYMKKFLGFDDKEVTYDAKTISVYPSSQPVGDEASYYDCLVGFLSELLYFEDLKTDLGVVNLNIKYNIVSKLSLNTDIHSFKTIILKK